MCISGFSFIASHDSLSFVQLLAQLKSLRPGATWIAEVLLEKLPLILPGVTLFMTPNDQSNSSFAHLLGWIENPSTGGDTPFTHTLKEVVVSHNPPVVTVFNVKEYGRRHLRTLEYTSNMSLCLHEVSGEPYPDRIGGVLAMSGGVPMTSTSPEPSLIITRALNSEMGTQMLIPSRFMAGLIPACLVDKYVFWQSEDDNIIGYEIPKDKAKEDEVGADTESSTRLNIQLSKHKGVDNSGFCNTGADAMVQRVAVSDSDEESENIDKNRPVLTLLNIVTAPAGSLLKQIGMLLSRLDNLSQVLVWSESEVLNVQQACTIDLIELPRVNLSFRSKRVEKIDGTIEHRLYSNDNDGLYIATSIKSRQLVEKLLGSIDHFIVLQNEDNDLFVLIPGCALPRRLVSVVRYYDLFVVECLHSPVFLTLFVIFCIHSQRMDLTSQFKSYWTVGIKSGSIIWVKSDATCIQYTLQSPS